MRSEDRASTSLAGWVLDTAGQKIRDVEVIDLSAGGARLAVPDGHIFPDELILEIPSRSEARRCQIRWRITNAVGVRFVDRRPAPPKQPNGATVSDHLLMIAVLKDENA